MCCTMALLKTDAQHASYLTDQLHGLTTVWIKSVMATYEVWVKPQSECHGLPTIGNCNRSLR